MSYGGKGDTYNNYGQSEGGEHGNETVGAEPEYERRIGAPQAPPGYIFQNTLSYVRFLFSVGFSALLCRQQRPMRLFKAIHQSCRQ